MTSPQIGDPVLLGGAQIIMQKFRRMCQTGKEPVPYESFLEHIAVIEAGQVAQKKGARVYLKDVWRR